jgi:uncharacterized protein DUF6236
MRDNALYFPYINVPQSSWFTRVLLYWDKVSSIVPSEYINHPERLSPFMRELLMAGLVEQVIPRLYVDEIRCFDEAFLRYIDNQSRKRQNNPITERKQTVQPVQIHLEKVGNIGNELVDRGLAKYKDYPWYDVDPWVANSFMAYLAATLGQLESISAAPITNSDACFSALGGVPHLRPADLALDRKHNPLRTLILKKLLPCPTGPVRITDVIKFKSRYGDSLQRFRRKIENGCIELTNIEDTDAQQERDALLLAEFEEEIAAITDALRSRWKSIVFNALLPLVGFGVTVLATKPLSVAAGLGASLSLGTAVYRALEGSKQYDNTLNRPLAYAALLRNKFDRS